MRRINNSSSRTFAAFARPVSQRSVSRSAATVLAKNASRPLASTRGLSLHLRPVGSRESVFDAFARDPFFRPFFEEVTSPATKLNGGAHSTVGRPAVPKEGPRLRPLQTNVNVMETNQAYAIEAEMPGLRKADIQLEVRNGDQLVIRGQKHFENISNNTDKAKVELKEAKEVSQEGGSEAAPSVRWHTFERSYGTFERTFVLPENADASKIKAQYTDGVLKVEIPKVAKESPKTWNIEIH